MTYRPDWLSRGVEVLIEELAGRGNEPHFDVVIVGSGYGGAVAAARFAAMQDESGEPLRVCVLERGREYVPGTFPNRLSDLPGHVRLSRPDEAGPKGQRDGLFDFRIGHDVSALVGNGLGGGSLINAGVAERPQDDVFADEHWPAALRADLDALHVAYETSERMLDAQPVDTRGIAKYEALRGFASTLGLDARPATAAINRKPKGPNTHGVPQAPCIRCGDCVTGCNFWAKNTLPMNYLAKAKRYGARLFTGATVSRVTRAGAGWSVQFRPTVAPHPRIDREDYRLQARHVVLAAGTYGSTEILLRSRAAGLALSTKLGKRFSTNGDMISVHAGYPGAVNAAPAEHAAAEAREVGPTITGMFQAGRHRAERVVVQELAIPGPLRRIFEEVVTTGALPVRLGRVDWSTHRPDTADAAAVDDALLERSQIFAAFGDDGAEGRLELAEGWDRTDEPSADGSIRTVWKGAGNGAVYTRQDVLLARSALLGGHYLRSPLWKPLPESLAGMLSGPKPDGKLFTVHPLGGCAMGEDADAGVVDDLGRVYDPAEAAERTRVHDGLLVLDGSIVPVALGINPLLTITALAERAVGGYAALRRWTNRADAAPPAPSPPAVEAPRIPPPPTTKIRFAERMVGDLALGLAQPLRRVHLDVAFADIGRVAEFLRTGPHAVPIRKATLSVYKTAGAEPAATEDAITRAEVSGTVYWMERGRSTVVGRTFRALLAWARIRLLADLYVEARASGWLKSLWRGRRIGAILALASNVGEVRHLRYALRLEQDLKIGEQRVLAKGTEIEGLKTFRYCVDGNPWRQLSELAVTLRPQGAAPLAGGRLEVDLEHMLHRFATQLQIVRQNDLPSALLDVGAIALFMARIVLKVHFWSFRAPEYERYDPERARRRLPQRLDGLGFERKSVHVAATGSSPSARGDGRTPIVLPLSRYWDAARRNPDATPVLVIHGFGASGAQFAHPRMPRNLVRHLAEQGIDVWVAELRTSIALPSSWNQWTLDEIAQEDIPAIVQRVLDETGHTQLDVVAHCIGSAMFCTAALAGTLNGKVRRASLLQVGPLIKLSKGNRFRGHVAAAMRRYMLADHVDSSIDDRADAFNLLVDRLLATYPYPDSELAAHRLEPPCVPHTHFANCNRAAAIFGRLIQHENVAPEMLDALGDLLGQTNLKTFEQTVQYAFYERLMHGEKNDVFHPLTTERSKKLLKSIFGPQHYAKRICLRGYGHLDPLIGRNAEQDVFAPISKFLCRGDLQATTQWAQRPARHARPPLVGPVLGWTRKEGRSWVARIWCRTDDRQSYPAFLMTIVLDAQGNAVPGYARSVPLYYVSNYVAFDIAGQLDLHGIADVPLPDAPGDYEIVVLGAHATAEADPRGAAQLAAARESAAPYGSFKSLELMKPWHANSVTGPAGERQVVVPEPLPEAYVRIIEQARKTRTAAERRDNGRRAQFPDDPGYEERPDAVRITAALLERLETQDRLEFALASCRYPGMMIDRLQADAMFGRLRALMRGDDGTPPSLLLLAGDQIYADATAGLFDPKSRRERFYDAYYEAWTAPNAREVLRSLPTYMTMDDHEAGDDWHPEEFVPVDEDGTTRATAPTRTPGMQDRVHAWALRAFREHQLAHSPWKTYVPGESESARLDRLPYGYWYRFAAAGFAFFVCDTRSRREGRRHIMSAELHAKLEEWLQAQQDAHGGRPKFVVSPSVVTPFLREAAATASYRSRADGWQGFPASLRRLFSFIAAQDIQNVVFLSGDPHCALTSTLEIEGANGTHQALCIVGSPMYAPYPFANSKPQDFAARAELALDAGRSMRYTLRNSSEGNSVTTVGVRKAASGWQVSVRVHGLERLLDEATFALP